MVRNEGFGFGHLRDQLTKYLGLYIYIYMEKKEMGVSVKTEDVVGGGSSSFPGYSFSSVFDFSEVEKSSLGFMELLGVQDYSPLLDLPQLSTMSVPHHHSTTTGKECSSEVLNQQQPATPNSSSISSASSEAVNDEQNKTSVDQPEEGEEDEEEEKQKTNKQWVLISIFLSHFFLFFWENY